MPRTDEVAFAIPRPSHVILTTFLFDADFEQCNQWREMTGVESLSRGANFDTMLDIMSHEPHNALCHTLC